MLDGGVDVREPILTAQEPFTWYNGFNPIDITPVDPGTQIILPWTFGAAAVTIDGPAIVANGGEPRVMSLVETRVKNAELTCRDQLDTALFNTGSNALQPTGLGAAVTTGNVYAGINRATSSYFNAQSVNAASGDPTFSLIQTAVGLATQGNTKPNIGITTQKIWNKLYAQAIPQQRFDGGDEVTVGWDFIKAGSMRIYVDSHCPAQTFYALNTEFIKLFVHQDYDYASTEWMPAQGQDAHTMRIHWGGNLIVNNPRFQAVITAINES